MKASRARSQSSGVASRSRPRRGGMPSTGVAERDRTILEVVDRGGLSITEHELRYQLRRRSVEAVAVLDRMMDLEQRGLVESTLCFRLTDAGIKSLPDGDDRPTVAGVRADWGPR